MLQCETVPVYQVLSQRQDALNIRFLLDTWKYKCLGNKHPDEVITDDGAALLMANVKSFAHCATVLEYDDKCFDALFHEKLQPATYMRLDRAHVIKNVLDSFSSLDKNKKRFYSRIFGLLILSEHIFQANTIIVKLFIVLLNRYQYGDHVSNAIKFLKEPTDTHHLPGMYNDTKNINKVVKIANGTDAENRVLKRKEQSKFFFRIQSIRDEITANEVNVNLNNSIEEPSNGIDENPFYAETMAYDWCLLLSRIHLWSNVMINCFGSNNKRLQPRHVLNLDSIY